MKSQHIEDIIDMQDEILKISEIEKMLIEENKSDVLLESSTIDELTTLFLRDIFDITVTKRVSESNRSKAPVSLIMMDIDDFKVINDTFGHQKGDLVLKSIGKQINLSIRKMDMAARYGGDEFAILMPDTTISTAIKIANRLKNDIKNINFKDFKITVSLGISQTSNQIISSNELIKIADTNLYKAKAKAKA